MTYRITMHKILFSLSLLMFVMPVVTHAVPPPDSIVVRVIPAVIDNQIIYPTGHATLALGPLDTAQWETLHLPDAWVNQGYYLELWDIDNEIVPGFSARKLKHAKIDLHTIDATIYPTIRVVLFQPAALSNPVINQAVYFQYTQERETRLIVFGISLAAAVLGWLALAWWQGVSLKEVWMVTRNLLSRKTLPSSWRLALILIAVIVVWSGVFGVALGWFIGGIQIIYLLIKLPVLLLGTFIFSVLSIWVLSALLGVVTSARDVVLNALIVLACISLALAALSPLLLFDIVLPQDHDQLLVSAVMYFGIAGVMGAARLYMWLSQHGRVRALALVVLWVVIYGGVLTQLGWMLRPWVGETDPIHDTVPFSRLYSGNVYVELSQTILRL